MGHLQAMEEAVYGEGMLPWQGVLWRSMAQGPLIHHLLSCIFIPVLNMSILVLVPQGTMAAHDLPHHTLPKSPDVTGNVITSTAPET